MQDHESTFAELCNLMDTTDFNRPPHRGILKAIAEELGLKGGRRSVYKSIRVSRTLDVMIKVAERIHEVDAQRNDSLQTYASTKR